MSDTYSQNKDVLSYVTFHGKRGLKSLSVNREIYFMVSVCETEISRREFKISRRVHPGLDLFHSKRENGRTDKSNHAVKTKE